MTTNPARQPKGRPTGGQFAAKSNPESEIELTHFGPAPILAAVSPTTTADFGRLRRIATERANLEVEETNIARSLIAAAVVGEYPSATRYVLNSEPDDMGGWYPTSIAVFDDVKELGFHELFFHGDDLGERVEDLAASAWPNCTEDSEESIVVVIAATQT